MASWSHDPRLTVVAIVGNRPGIDATEASIVLNRLWRSSQIRPFGVVIGAIREGLVRRGAREELHLTSRGLMLFEAYHMRHDDELAWASRAKATRATRTTNVTRLTKFTPQSLLFDRKRYTKAQAVAWVRKHAGKGYVILKEPEITKSFIRIRQLDPKLVIPGTWGTVTFGKGVKAVFGHVRVGATRALRRAA